VCKLAIIGGSGLYAFPGLQEVQEHALVTPFGPPSAPIVTGAEGLETSIATSPPGPSASQAIAQSVFEGNSALRDALEGCAKDRGGALSAKRLAAWLRSRDGRIVAGNMFVRAGETRNHVTLWKIKDVSE